MCVWDHGSLQVEFSVLPKFMNKTKKELVLLQQQQIVDSVFYSLPWRPTNPFRSAPHFTTLSGDPPPDPLANAQRWRTDGCGAPGAPPHPPCPARLLRPHARQVSAPDPAARIFHNLPPPRAQCRPNTLVSSPRDPSGLRGGNAKATFTDNRLQ